MSPIEPMNRRKTSNIQPPTSNNQWFPIGPLIGGWRLDVGCSMFPRVHGEPPIPKSGAHWDHEPLGHSWERRRLAGELRFPAESDTPAGRWRSQEVHGK